MGIRREKRRLHGDVVRVRRDVIRQDQYRRLAVAHEFPRYREYEIATGAKHVGQKSVDHLMGEILPASAQVDCPPVDVVVVEIVGILSIETDGLRDHGRGNALRRPLQEVPDERTANTETHDHKLVDAQMIHDAQMIIGVCIPWPVDLQRTG